MNVKGEGLIIHKSYILSKVEEREIFERYLGVTVNLNITYTNPLREDPKPGCKFFITRSGRLKFNDFGRRVYDCFDIVSVMYGLNFKDTLLKVAKDFDLISNSYGVEGEMKVYNNSSTSSFKGSLSKNGKISVEVRPFSNREKKYWISLGISGALLKRFNVYAINKAYYRSHNYNGVLYIRKSNELAFGYFVEGSWKLYFPERTENRFYQATAKIIQGYSELPVTGVSVIITKSYKDVIAFASLGYNAVAPQSETVGLDEKFVDELFDRFENVYVLYDNDWSGKRATVNVLLEYPNIIPLLFGKHQKKDLCENILEYGREHVKAILEQHIMK